MKSLKPFAFVFLTFLLLNVLTMDVIEHPKDTSFWKPNCSKDDVECWKR